MTARTKNTKEKGNIEFFVYKTKSENAYTGVCLTFDIVEEGSNPDALMKSLEEAALLHLEAVRIKNLSDTLLNRPAPKKYWNKYLSSLVALTHKPATPVSFQVSPYMSDKLWARV